MQFKLSRFALPDNKMVRRQLLDGYFPSGLIPFEEFEGNEWKITPFIPDDPSCYVDPQIEKNIKLWQDHLSIESLGNYRRFYKNAMLSFYDSWSLMYWSLSISWLREMGLMPQHIALFHVDDHSDLGSPHLFVKDQCYECIFSNQQVDFKDTNTIEQAILQKSVGIDSYITPFLHELTSVSLMHLRYAHKGQDQKCGLECVFEEDGLLAKGKKRPALKFCPLGSHHTYFLSSNPVLLLEEVKNFPVVFLHLDCDAFCNRYNLDTNCYPKKVSIDLNLFQIKNLISQLLSLFNGSKSLIFMNVALSPGFFPSEYWQDICKHIFDESIRHGIVKDDEFSEHLKIVQGADWHYEVFS